MFEARRRMATGADPESTLALMERVRAGDTHALDQLLLRYLPSLRRWASGRLPLWARDSSDTQDLVQDAVLHSLKHLPSLQIQHEGALQAYLRQSVMNGIRDHVRRAQRRPAPAALDDELPASLSSPLEEAIGREALERYDAALATLRDDDRAAVVARIELGHSYAEIAIALNKPTADAARIAVHRAVARLAACMNNVR